MDKVNVLMSTFNGMNYIDEQLQSILKQRDVEVEIHIRDDNSTDGTFIHIKNRYPEVEIYRGENIGYKKSFMELLSRVDKDGYFAFSDQDDVWKSDKLKVALAKIKELDQSKPALYCSNLTLVESNLKFIQLLHNSNEKLHSTKECALVENITYGCTSVFNRSARDWCLKSTPKFTSHDGWLNLTCTYFGNVSYDENSYILYRQHDNNVLGGKRGLINVWEKRLKKFDIFNHYRDISAKEFLEAYSEYLTNEDEKLIKKVSEYRKHITNKISLLINFKIHMTTFDRDFWYRVRILFSSI